MALESSDLNDGQILQQTKQRTDPKGNIQFVIQLPSGRDLTSEWIQKDNVRSAMRTWLEVVKEQAVADSNEERLKRAALSKRPAGKMDIERRPGDDQPLFRAGGARETVPTGTIEIVDAPRPEEDERPIAKSARAAIIPDSDYADIEPLEFAQKQRQYWAQKVAALRTAEKALRRWSIIVEQLEEDE